MTKTISLALASVAFLSLAAGVGVTAWGAMPAPMTTLSAENLAPMVLAENEGHDDEGGASAGRSNYGEDEDSNACESEDGACNAGPAANAPAPAGTIAPPKNGLFGNGAAAPKAVVK